MPYTFTIYVFRIHDLKGIASGSASWVIHTHFILKFFVSNSEDVEILKF